MGGTMIALSLISWFLALPWVLPVLIAFGLGFGVFTVGGVSLLMAMNEEKLAATYLALWTVIQLISRGAGIAFGGALRDILVSLTGSLSQAYAGVFLIEAVGLFFCVYLLSRVDVRSFAQERIAASAGLETLAAAAD
jgi:BCD family chlorophyll transporter-like MFS transporter